MSLFCDSFFVIICPSVRQSVQIWGKCFFLDCYWRQNSVLFCEHFVYNSPGLLVMLKRLNILIYKGFVNFYNCILSFFLTLFFTFYNSLCPFFHNWLFWLRYSRMLWSLLASWNASILCLWAVRTTSLEPHLLRLLEENFRKSKNVLEQTFESFYYQVK